MVHNKAEFPRSYVTEKGVGPSYLCYKKRKKNEKKDVRYFDQVLGIYQSWDKNVVNYNFLTVSSPSIYNID